MLFTMRETYVDCNPKVLGIAPLAIIDRQLPFEYTITSRSTDVVVMALPDQNINYSALKSMFEREKLSGTNFNDWFHRLKLVLRVEKKMFVIEQPIPPAPATDSEANVLAKWNAVYDAHNEVACLMLGSMTLELHRQFENYSPYEMLQELKSMFEKQAEVESVGLILNGPISDFAGFVRNYNMHNMGKTIDEIHALLIEYEKGLPKKAETPQVMMIKSGKIQKANKKSLKAKVSKNNVVYFNAIHSNAIYEIHMHNLVPNNNYIYNLSTKRTKHNLDSTYLWHCRLAHISKKRIEKLQQEGLLRLIDDESFDQCISCLSGKMKRKLFPHRPKRATDLLGIIHTDVCGLLRHVSRQGASYFITFTDDYSRYGYVYLLKHEHKLTPPYTPHHTGVSERRNRTLLDMVQSMMNLTTLSLSLWDYALESATRILNMVPTKKVDKTPYELWYGKVPNLSYLKVWGCEALVKQDTPEKLQQRSVKSEFFKKSLVTQEVSGRAIDLEKIQDEDTSPFEITSEIPMEVEGFKPPQEELISIRRPERTHQAPSRLCLNVEAEEHSLGDLNEPTSYKAAMLDPESNKWLDAMNAKMQSMIDNMVWVLVDLPPNYKTVRTSRSWNKRFDEEIKKFGFVQNLDEPCVYQKASGSNVTFLILYVDDIIIIGNHIPSLQSVKDYLGKCFAIKDLGEAAFILGIKIYRDRSKRLIRLSQSAYMDQILKRDKMDNSKRGNIPMQERLELNKKQGASTPEEVKRMQNVPYASAVGSIMYLVRCTRPDVAFAQNITSRFQQNPGEPH
ncbi:retrotransposon protein, putative, ty1-copia subclass, partial [Tanacetum coccineum]